MVTEGERWGTDKLGIWHSKGDCKGRKTKRLEKEKEGANRRRKEENNCSHDLRLK